MNADTENSFCTLAVTGTDPSFQAIFLCNECILVLPEENKISEGHNDADVTTTTTRFVKTQQQSPLCVCQSCAEICHDDIGCTSTFIGMGPSYCDCNRLGNCKLYQKSLREAERLGIIPISTGGHRWKQQEISPCSSYIREVFDVPILQDEDAMFTTLLVRQAQELIRHTKETHWVDKTLVSDVDENNNNNNSNDDDESLPKQLCLLENLAWSIYRSHQERHLNNFSSFDVSCDDKHDGNKGGAEWWVQVKNMPVSVNTIDDSDNDTMTTAPSSSIDLHYDKDEALAETFGIGSFPTLSTVTYLTASSVLTTTAAEPKASALATPTIVFDRTYNKGEDEVMSSILVSRPRLGKYLLFDGRLLHGAPSHPSLMSSSSTPLSSKKHDNNNDTTGNNNEHNMPENEEDRDRGRQMLKEIGEGSTAAFRVTFLVNIWTSRRPANVKILDDKVRGCMLNLPQPTIIDSVNDVIQKHHLKMIPLTIPEVSFKQEEDLPESLRHRIELPFVSNQDFLNSDDNEDGDDNEGCTVVMTFLPPTSTDDTVLVTFGDGMQAYLDHN